MLTQNFSRPTESAVPLDLERNAENEVRSLRRSHAQPPPPPRRDQGPLRFNPFSIIPPYFAALTLVASDISLDGLKYQAMSAYECL